MANPIDALVRDFHVAMNIPVASSLAIPPDARVRLRATLIAEEFFETMASMFGESLSLADARSAMRAAMNGEPRVDLVELADGLCDLDYVVAGTRLEFGIDGEAVLAEVHRSNLTKVGGPVRADGKIGKPTGWQPPDIAGVLERQRAR